MWSRIVVAGIVGSAVGAAIWFGPWREFRLPERIAVQEVAADLSGGFDRNAVLAEDPAAPVALGELVPHADGPNGARRPSIVAPPPARVRFRVHVPSDAALEFSLGVQGTGKRDRGADGVRFTVELDGRPAYARTVNPAADRHDRQWFDGRVALGAAAGRDVEITLGTAVSGGAGRLSGTPGWSHIRVVRETREPRQPAGRDAPSVLVLLVDTLRADALGCYGATPSPTPVLDGLAARGVRFEHVIAQSSWTLPSVATLFTGLHPASHGVTGASAEASFLSDALPTLATRAEAAGITTVGVSGNLLISRGTNLAHGFETFVEFARDPTRPDWASADEINATFLRWLRRNRTHRFLGYLHYMEPHQPYTPPADLRPAAPDGLPRPVANGRVEELTQAIAHGRAAPLPPPALGYLRQLYDAEVRAWDRALAGLVDGLAALGVSDRTVLVVTADHGEEFEEHGRLGHATQLYDELLRVPLVIAGPGVEAARVPDLVQGVDLCPTVTALLGLPPSPGLPGENLLGARVERPAVSETASGIAPDDRYMPLIALRTATWKLIYAPALQRYELYDLARDPGERDNRFAFAGEGAKLARTLAAWRRSVPAPPRADGVDPALHEKLRALGYVD